MVKAEAWSRTHKQSKHFIIFRNGVLGERGHQCKRKKTVYSILQNNLL